MKPQVNLTNLWHGWLGRRVDPTVRQARTEAATLRQQMAEARQEWEAADRYFQNVTDPELVDHAIYSMEAAKRKYLYLYRRLRQIEGEISYGEESPWM